MPVHRRLAIRLAALAAIQVLITILWFAGATWQRDRRAVEEHFGSVAQAVAATAALGIDGDAHRTIHTLPDADGAAFRGIRDHLRQVQHTNGLREDLIYTFHVLPGGTAVSAVMLQDVPYTGESYVPTARNAALLHQVVTSAQPAHSTLYTDAHGRWVSGYAPILDSAGAVAGVVEADFDVSEVDERLEAERRALAALAGTILLAAVLATLLYVRRLEAALHAIREGAEAIEGERYAHRVEVHTGDELELVADRFNRMAQVLSERFQLLKFLPAYALAAAQQRAEGGEAPRSERVEAAILFSDIRGFTALTSGVGDEAVVRMLQAYLARQADQVIAHGGQVDKFIGDAVLAVFTGPDHAARAVAAALALQDGVAELNSEGVFRQPVGVGVGVAAGSLLLTEIGSDARRERTLIGSVVNLASRLCGQAAAGEVVVAAGLEAGVADVACAPRNVRLKGFAGEVACVALSRDPGPLPG
ncbi:MAG: class 3 adenylate cyclase [Myxococcota bacterium]|jgi:class 3 adenylate cyclase